MPVKEAAEQGSASVSPLLVVMSGPSGVGKDTVLTRLKSLTPGLRQVITATTRPSRRGEVKGRDYHFVSHDLFRRMLRDGQLLEHALVYGHWYGVPKAQVMELLNQGYDVLLRTDVQGAATIKNLAPEGLFIFIAPGSVEELAARLKRRDGEQEGENQLRLATAPQEMDAKEMFDHVVINREGKLDETVARIQAILQTERERQPPRRVVLS